jgi:prolyl-tRNA editing enzyme YbaK/EbsC (Cys-tRNA(Pro) deacylase)
VLNFIDEKYSGVIKYFFKGDRHVHTLCLAQSVHVPGTKFTKFSQEAKMALEEARRFLESKNYGDRIILFDVSSATVELAANALGTEPARIAKSLTFMVNDAPVMVVCAGDAKVNNSKYKKFFGTKAKMLTPEEVRRLIGQEVGGVCPFGIKDGVKVYLDVSLRRFDKVFPACGNAASAVELSPDELFELAGSNEWIDVCVVIES